MTTAPLAARLTRVQGPLFVPVTAYGPDGVLDLDVYRTHVRRGVAAGAAAGAVPVVAGAGYGTALAVEFARLAADAGADGLLALPPVPRRRRPGGAAPPLRRTGRRHRPRRHRLPA